MSITCGFFNAVNHDRTYNALEMSSIFDGIIQDGVFMDIGDALKVTGNPGEDDLHNMYVYVHPGRCWFNHTWTLNDAIEPILVPEAEMVLDRIDTLVLEVNHNDAVRECIIKIVKGTPATEPTAAELEDSEYVHQHALARIYVASGVTEIRQDDITNCIGLDETPYVSGILETQSAQILYEQWDAQFNTWLKDVTAKLRSAEVLDIVKSVLYYEVKTTLAAGDTTIEIEDFLIDGLDAMKLEFFTDIWEVSPNAAPVITGNKLTVTFDAQATNMKVLIRVGF